MNDDVYATVEVIDGQVVLNDPVAEGVISAIDSHNAGITWSNLEDLFNAQLERVAHFKNRMTVLNKSPEDFVIVIINADCPFGGPLAESLMPGHDWQPFRDRGEMPVARGIASRGPIQNLLSTISGRAAEQLEQSEGVATVVVSWGTARVFS